MSDGLCVSAWNRRAG